MVTARVTVIVLPVYKHGLLYHAWQREDGSARGGVDAAAAADLDWWHGRDLQDKLATCCRQMNNKFDASVKTQWREMQVAADGSFRSYLYKLAQLVLSREDPDESFLKSLPSGTRHIEVMYPASMDEAQIRRRMRMMVLRRSATHQRRILGWGLATIPQTPLMLTPLPNVTVYFSVYRLLSNFQAMQGASTLRAAFESPGYVELQQAHSRLEAARARGSQRQSFLSRWNRNVARDLANAEQEYQRLLERHSGGAAGPLPVVAFVPSTLLDEVTKPMERWRTPLSEESVLTLSQYFHLDNLAEHYKRARGKALPNDESWQQIFFSAKVQV